MLKRFEVENFQAFGAGQVADLAPITLIFGPNSAGKSSLIRALMAVVQSFPAPDESYPLNFDGREINLGTFEAAAHRHDTARSPRFALTFTPAPGFLAEISCRLVEEHRGDTMGVSLKYALLDGQAKLREVEFRGIPVEDARYQFLATTSNSNVLWLGKAPDLGFIESTLMMLPEAIPDEKRRSDVRARILTDGEDTFLTASDDRWEGGDTLWIKDAMQTLPWKRPVRVGFDCQGTDEWVFYPIAVLFGSFCSRTTFLAPLRPTPSRPTVVIPGSAPTRTRAGEDVPTLLQQNPDLLSYLNEALPQYGFDYQIKVEQTVQTDPWNKEVRFRLILHDLQRDGIEVLLTDVGVGVSQALPIMAEALRACAVQSRSSDLPPLRELLVVEQPEIHLHPRLQSQFADFLTWTAGIDSGQLLAAPLHPIQWLVETHSEAIMLRLQRRIRERRISADSISVLYVSPGSNGSTIQRLRLDEDGYFRDDWPDGFFVERIDELLSGHFLEE